MFFKTNQPEKITIENVTVTLEGLFKTLSHINKSLDQAREIDPEPQQKAIQQLNAQFTNEAFKIHPLIQTEENQKIAYQKITDLRQTYTQKSITFQRDHLLNHLAIIQLNLHTLSSVIQSTLIEILYLEHQSNALKAESEDLKLGMESLDAKFISTMDNLLKTYDYLCKLAISNSGFITATLMLIPGKDMSLELSRDMFTKRAALYVDTEHYQRFQDLLKSLSQATKIFTVSPGFVENHPEFKETSKQILNKLPPIIEKIEQSYSESIINFKFIASFIEQNKLEDLRQIMSQSGPKI